MMHYYKKDGSSCHEVVGKNGKTRPTTIRDARALQLYPSVTTIMDIQSKPALIQWLQNQILEAAMASPFNDEWYPDGWKKFIVKKSREIGEKAAKRGNEIHDIMEKSIKAGRLVVHNSHDANYVKEAFDLLYDKFPNYTFVAEASFAHEDGFGGRVDLYGYDLDGNYIILDFKTKDKSDEKHFVQYDDHCIQLAAYQVGLGLPDNTRRFNLFISVHEDTPGMCKLVECVEFDKYKNWFYSLIRTWQIKNSYKPEVTDV